MQWQGQRESSNVEDRRGMSPTLAAGSGVGTIVVLIICTLMGVDPRIILNGGGGSSPKPRTEQRQSAPQANDTGKKFVSVVLADTEDVWHEILPKQTGVQYQDPHLVLFTDRVQSACGMAGSATGPFYCPGDQNVYIDLGFYRELKDKLGAPGDFAQAYVIAHEVGHHVQTLLGKMGGGAKDNDTSVRTELQADFYAGVWAHYAQQRGILEAGDIEEALNAAAAIGDDRLQQETQGYVVPDSFTHGSSEQRVRWFKKGFDTGDVRQGDTFHTSRL